MQESGLMDEQIPSNSLQCLDDLSFYGVSLDYGWENQQLPRLYAVKISCQRTMTDT